MASSSTSVAGRLSPNLCFSTKMTVDPTLWDADPFSNSAIIKCCMTPVLCFVENNNVAASVVVSFRHNRAICRQTENHRDGQRKSRARGKPISHSPRRSPAFRLLRALGRLCFQRRQPRPLPYRPGDRRFGPGGRI